MLFNSPEYIFIFLPATLIIYFTLCRYRLVTAGKVWLVLSSLFFYGYWKAEGVFLIFGSVLINFLIGTTLRNSGAPKGGSPLDISTRRKPTLIAGLVFNLGLLGYYKYVDFFIENVNQLLGTPIPLINQALPLAISFFTFQQIAYLIDCYYSKAQEYSFLNYFLFVSFFPQLIAGPIVHHREMMPQFMGKRGKLLNWKNLTVGCSVFFIGLFKKVAIADTFAIWASSGFDAERTLTFLEAWGASLSYSFQLYFDFSGYSDMAIGAALMFNIHLPINFNSPYKAYNIRDFWRRWHMTLSRWLRDCLYIPLGGNRKGISRTYVNILITFFLAGLWHGAGWTFVVWGVLHGAALNVHRAWGYLSWSLPRWLSWLCTFQFLNVSWVVFRAQDMESAASILKSMADFSSTQLSLNFLDQLASMHIPLYKLIEGYPVKTGVSEWSLLLSLAVLAVVIFNKNSMQIKNEMLANSKWFTGPKILSLSLMISFALILLLSTSSEVFLYFNF